MSTVASVVNLVRSQVYHNEHWPLFAACLLRCSVSRGFVSDSRYLFIRQDSLPVSQLAE